jgi:hypothetical protein
MDRQNESKYDFSNKTVLITGGTLPFVSDDAGTPFAVTVIPTDDGLARSAAR